VEGYPDEGYNDTCWLTGLRSTQAKVEGIVVKAAWHWGSDCSVVKYDLGGTRPHLIVCRPSVHVGAPWTVTKYYSRFSWRAPYWGL